MRKNWFEWGYIQTQYRSISIRLLYQSCGNIKAFTMFPSGNDTLGHHSIQPASQWGAAGWRSNEAENGQGKDKLSQAGKSKKGCKRWQGVTGKMDAKDKNNDLKYQDLVVRFKKDSIYCIFPLQAFFTLTLLIPCD